MNEIKNLKIEKLDHLGRGIIRDNGIIFVEDALPGDIVDIEIKKDKKGIKEAEVLNYKKRSEYFQKASCPYSKECGGCNIINLIYEQQLKYKREKVQELVNKMLKENIIVKQLITSNQEKHYRNKIKMHSGDNKIGLYKKKSNELIEIDECQLVDDRINQIIRRIKKYIDDKKVNICDLTIKTTTLNEDMIIIHGHLDYEDFRKEFLDIKVIIINDQVVTKDKYIKERILDKEFYISNHSFFQVNEYTTELLYKKVIDLLQDKKYDKCLDLYCGTGTISILVSDYVNEVYGIEVEKDAIDDANRNKELNGKENIQFILGKTEDCIDRFNCVDLVIVDPPRAGLDRKTRETLKKIKAAKMIYISCDPVTLMRDLQDLKNIYDIDEITPVDMFPNTYHVECVCMLSFSEKE